VAGKSTPKATTEKQPARPLARPKGRLSKATLGKFRELLFGKRRALVGDMSGIEAETIGVGHVNPGDVSNVPTHPADIGTDNFEHEFSLGLLESERVMLAEIDDALARIDQGTYGICLGTGKPISKTRLQAKPWAKYCIEYAHRIEAGLVRPGVEDIEE